MTREEAGRRGREIAARARAQKSEYYTDGNTVRHIKPQNRITNPYISKDKNKNKKADSVFFNIFLILALIFSSVAFNTYSIDLEFKVMSNFADYSLY